MTTSIYYILLFVLLFAQPVKAVGQSTVKVVTRTVTQKWEVNSASKLIIKGENRLVFIFQDLLILMKRLRKRNTTEGLDTKVEYQE